MMYPCLPLSMVLNISNISVFTTLFVLLRGYWLYELQIKVKGKMSVINSLLYIRHTCCMYIHLKCQNQYVFMGIRLDIDRVTLIFPYSITENLCPH